jgi:hypothetical protein
LWELHRHAGVAGTDTDSVLGEPGYAATEVAALRAARVI